MARRNPIHLNRLLAGLSARDRALLAPDLAPAELALRQVLEAPGKAISTIYFIEHGIASVVAGDPGRDIEVGIIGREGMTGAAILLGNRSSPLSTYMQIAGAGQRIRTPALRRALRQSPSLHAAFLKYVPVFLTQTAHTALVNGRFRLDARLARWLLMAHDRMDGRRLPLTHEFLGVMLGVGRPIVTVTLSALERQGLIKVERGSITLLDRRGIRAIAGRSYAGPEPALRRQRR